jgi:serine/threonine protein kinase
VPVVVVVVVWGGSWAHVQTVAKAKPPVCSCDLKPSNLLLDENGRLKLGGFGLSRRLADINKTPMQALPPVCEGVKGGGCLAKGKILFMPPVDQSIEQRQGLFCCFAQHSSAQVAVYWFLAGHIGIATVDAAAVDAARE